MAVHESPAQTGLDDLAGRDGRAGRAALQDHAHRAGCLRRREPAPRRGGAQGVRVHRRARAGPPPRRYRACKRRVSARRHDARERREAEARLPEGRHGDRGKLEWDQRWGRGATRDLPASQAARAHRRDGGRRRGSFLHGARAHPRDPEGPQTRWTDARPDRPDRAERGVRGAGDRVHPRAQTRSREGEHLRGGDRVGPPTGRHRCEAFDDSRTRLTPYEVPLRFMYHVYRRRPGNRHDRGAGIMAAYERVLVEITGGIGTVTLNRPDKLNALDRPLCDDLREALALLTQSDVVRVIVITGAGRAFCAGADLDVLEEDGPALVAAGKDVALALRAAPQPVLAAVNGPAAGRGANLALACDYRNASDQASIGQVFHKLGLVPDWGGSFFLPRLVGTSRALELVWSARTVAAPEALALGLFDRVVPHAELLPETRRQAELWAAQPVEAVRRAKEAVYASEGRSLERMLDFEIVQQSALLATPEARERIAEASPAKRSR